MRADFLVIVDSTVEVGEAIERCVADAIESVQAEIEFDSSPADLLSLRYQLRRDDSKYIVGCSLDIPDEVAGLERLITDFLSAANDPGNAILHIVKFSDDNLLAQNQVLTQELFALEMQLREVLTVLFADGGTSDFYHLLEEASASPKSGKEAPDVSAMVERGENEFFYLLFSDYLGIDSVAPVKDVRTLLSLVAEHNSYDSLRVYLSRTSLLTRSDYLAFLASLRSFLAPVEKVRNAVAHNRRASASMLVDYRRAASELSNSARAFLEELDGKDRSVG